MEDWQAKIIKDYNKKLVEYIHGNVCVLSGLFSRGLISPAEKSKLKKIDATKGEYEQASELLDTIVRKDKTDRGEPAFDTFIEILNQEKQSGAANLLTKAKNDYFNAMKASQMASGAVSAPSVATSNPLTVKIPKEEVSRLLQEYREEILKPEAKRLSIPASLDLCTEITPELQNNACIIKSNEETPENIALIINISKFCDEKKNRSGSEHYVYYMRTLWKKLGFEIFQERGTASGDWTKQKILATVEAFIVYCKEVLPKAIVIFIGSHGENGKIFTSDPKQCPEEDRTIYPMRDIFSKFYNESLPKEMHKIPKIFLVNACQVFPLMASDDMSIEKDPVSNMIVCYSQVPGKKSFRCEKSGSWFVHCLTFCMLRLVKTADFLSIFKVAVSALLERKGIEKSGEVGTECKQVCWYESFSLEKDIVFRKVEE